MERLGKLPSKIVVYPLQAHLAYPIRIGLAGVLVGIILQACIENLDPSVPRFSTGKGSLLFEFSRYRGFAGDALAPVRDGTSIDAKHLSGGLVESGTVWAVVHLRPRL